MAKALDLRQFNKGKTWDLILPTGETLHIAKPTQAQVIQMQALEELNQDDPAEVAAELNNLTLMILNSNTNNMAFTQHDIDNEALGLNSIDIRYAIVMGYWEFIRELLSIKN